MNLEQIWTEHSKTDAGLQLAKKLESLTTKWVPLLPTGFADEVVGLLKEYADRMEQLQAAEQSNKANEREEK